MGVSEGHGIGRTWHWKDLAWEGLGVASCGFRFWTEAWAGWAGETRQLGGLFSLGAPGVSGVFGEFASKTESFHRDVDDTSHLSLEAARALNMTDTLVIFVRSTDKTWCCRNHVSDGTCAP